MTDVANALVLDGLWAGVLALVLFGAGVVWWQVRREVIDLTKPY
jgi:hypothetical protein